MTLSKKQSKKDLKKSTKALNKKTEQKTPKKKFRIFRFLIRLAFVLLLLFTVFFTFIIIKYNSELPDYNTLKDYNPSITSRIYASDGSLLTEYAEEKRIFVEYEDIPPQLINAFIAAEDQRFWKHNGIDLMGISRAIITNAIKKVTGGSGFSGASTITQQVSKNFFLTNDRTMSRKLKEVLLSLKIERVFPKEYIMTLYLNQIFLGNRAYGVAAAAQNYFNKPLAQLTISEMAVLASLPKAPSAYNPKTNPKKAFNRRNWVLKRMFDEGFISSKELEEYKLEPVSTTDSFSQELKTDSLYFSEEVRKNLADKYGLEEFYNQGFSIFTTSEPKVQQALSKALRDGLEKYDIEKGLRSPKKVYPMNDIYTHIKNKDLLELKKIFKTSANSKYIIKNSQNKDQILSSILKIDSVESGMYQHGWKKAIVKSYEKDFLSIVISGRTNGKILFSDLKKMYEFKNTRWRVKLDPNSKTQMDKILPVGSIIFVQESKDKNIYNIKQVPKINGAIIAMNPKNGKVYGLSGGFTYATSKFNRATQALRQPGSTIKPFVYLSALESGRYTPTTELMDVPFVIKDGSGRTWKPENYDRKFLGKISFRKSLETSRNNPTIRIANDIGMDDISKTFVRFGIYDEVPSRQRTLSLAIGAKETTLLNMVSAYCKIANGGKTIQPTLIEKIQDRYGKVIYKSNSGYCENCKDNWEDLVNAFDGEENILPPAIENNQKQIADSRIVYQMINILQGVVSRGTGSKARVSGHTLIGKTGTSNDGKDIWFIGGTPDMIIGIYMGFDKPESLGYGGAGGVMAAPVVKQAFEEILKDTKPKKFKVPNGIGFIEVFETNDKKKFDENGNEITIPNTKIIQESMILNDSINSQNPSSNTGVIMDNKSRVYKENNEKTIDDIY